jgi:hypothetical protein
MLFVCLVVLVGLVVLGSVLMLLFVATATLPPSTLRSCPEFDLCGAPAPDAVDDSPADGQIMTH